MTLRQLAAEGCSAFSTSATSSTRSGRCATRSHRTAGRSRRRLGDPRLETNAAWRADARRGALAQSRCGRRGSASRSGSRCEANLSPVAEDPSASACGDQSRVHSGEILGMAGVSGNGQEELLPALSGEDLAPPRRKHSPVRPRRRGARPGAAPRAGAALRPRRATGPRCGAGMSLADNTLLTRRHGRAGAQAWCTAAQRGLRARHLSMRFAVKCDGGSAAADSLSGGNLQKFIVGREIRVLRPR